MVHNPEYNSPIQHPAAMAKYCKLAQDSIQRARDTVKRFSDAPFQLNTQQCWFLASRLAKIAGLLQNLDRDTLTSGSQIALHLLSTIQKAELLVEKCCCTTSASWLVAAITLVDIEEEFAAILLDLHETSMTLQIAIGTAQDTASGESHGLKVVTQLERLAEIGSNTLDDEGIRPELHQAAVEDKASILSKLVQVQQPEYSEPDCVTASYLLSWLKGIAPPGQTTPETSSCGIDEEELQPELQQKLVEGAFCTVWKVTWLGLPCALKQFKLLPATVNREASALRDLSHPNIMRLYYYWHDPVPRMLMELMPHDLHTYMHLRGVDHAESWSHDRAATTFVPFRLAIAIDIMLQIAQAMRYLHERNLTHRDLKPRNVLVRAVSARLVDRHTQGYLDVKLADFGSAKRFDGTGVATRHTMNTGTTIYGAPEIFNPEWVVGSNQFMRFGADVWSFGIVCAEILSGETPYGGLHSRKELPKRIHEGLRPTLSTDCPGYLAFCIRGCWEYEPGDRPDFASLCKLLRRARSLSLNSTSVEDTTSKSVWKYTTQAGAVKVYEPAYDAEHRTPHWYDPLLTSSSRFLIRRSSKRHRVR